MLCYSIKTFYDKHTKKHQIQSVNMIVFSQVGLSAEIGGECKG